jgi:hypothetical protein
MAGTDAVMIALSAASNASPVSGLATSSAPLSV